MNNNVKLSISIPLEGKMLKEVNLLIKNLKKKYNLNFINDKSCRPHINLFSGVTSQYQAIKKILDKNKKKFKIKKINTNGFGVFLGKKSTIYLRFKNNKNFNIIRGILLRNKKYWKKIDSTVLENDWLPKTTIAHKDLNLSSLSIVSKYIIQKKIKNEMKMSEIIFLDYTKSEVEIDKIKLL